MRRRLVGPSSSTLKERSPLACLNFGLIYVHFGTRYIPVEMSCLYSLRGNPDSNAGEIQNACPQPPRGILRGGADNGIEQCPAHCHRLAKGSSFGCSLTGLRPSKPEPHECWG
jgi:hypothetical protein